MEVEKFEGGLGGTPGAGSGVSSAVTEELGGQHGPSQFLLLSQVGALPSQFP